MKSTCLGLLAFAAVISTPTVGFAQKAEVPADTMMVGGRSITVPPPVGFFRCDGIHAGWDHVMTGFIPASNRLLANYGTQADQAALKGGGVPDFSSNCNLQVTRSIEDREIGELALKGTRDEMKSALLKMRGDMDAQLGKSLSVGNERMHEDFDTTAALSLSDCVFLGFFNENESALGFTMALNVKVRSANGSEEKARAVTAAIMVTVNGRLIYLYSTVPYHSEADRVTAEKTVTAWCKAVVAANPRVEGAPVSDAGIFSGGLRSAIFGGVVGGLVGLLVVLKKKFTKR